MMGKVPKILGATYTVAGILAIAVSVVRFAMAQHLRHLIAGWVEGSGKELVLAVFILLIGVILVLAGMRGVTWTRSRGIAPCASRGHLLEAS